MRKYFLILLLTGCVPVSAQDTTRLSLLFLGDIMQHDSQINAAFDPVTKKYDYTSCFQFVKRYTQSVDLAIGNLELTLAGPPYKGYPQFSAPDDLLVALKDMGMDILVTANNHCVDRSKQGLERTIQMLDSLKIPHTGTFVDEVGKLNDHPLMITKNGFKLALLNYTYGTNGLPVTKPNIVNLIDTTEIGKDIQKARSLKPDVIIVFTHWGSEYQSLPSSWQKEVTEFCFKKGVQLVIGSHPHVVQPMVWDKNRNQLIAYSLGNFVSGQRNRYTDGGAMINIELEKISFDSDNTQTKIDTANYILEWVYRTVKEKDYYVLPVPVFEKDTTGFIKDADSRAAFKLFAEDSRSLFGKHNIGVTESMLIPSDSVITYKVMFTIRKDSAKSLTLPPIPYAMEMENDSDGNILYYSEDFLRKKDAENFSRKMEEHFGFKHALIIPFINGRKKE